MEKEQYLYMIINNIEKAIKLREGSKNQKEFHKKINSDEDIIRSIDNNIILADKTIESLENIAYLPVYEIIMKMSNNDLLKYKNNIITDLNNKILNEENIINEINEKIKEFNCLIESFSVEYSPISENDDYITKCKKMADTIKELKKDITAHKKFIDYFTDKKNNIEKNNLEDIREYLINTYDLNRIKFELDRYKVTRCDEIIVNLCKDLNILDEIELLIKKYIKIKNTDFEKIIKFPENLSDYKINNVYDINDFILKNCFDTNFDKKNNEAKFTKTQEIDIMKTNVESLIKEINSRKHSLILFKLEINDLNKLSFDDINKELVDFVIILCDSLYLTALEKNNVKSLYSEYIKLVNKKHKTEYNVNKLIKLEKELKQEIKNILDVYWSVLCDRLETSLLGLKTNIEFVSNIKSYNIHNKKDNNLIMYTEEFSEMGLLNMRIVIENILRKYSELINELNGFSEELSSCKENIIDIKNINEQELIAIKNKIDNLYYKISPNDFPILISDYESLNKIFIEKTLIDSIVKINRKNLISKVRSESVKYRDKNEDLSQNIDVITKKVLKK